ncbi:hypothetical protein [Nocardia wallacei]|uniref:hypothetical protein n=1 Tax=Nocardia wallacei TaxID=480035 RepID=UPI002457154E|nr:hypothetical protein [Nocardia wallacei]
MFRQFAEASEHPSDLAAVKAIEPTTRDLAEWIRSTGWTAPADRSFPSTPVVVRDLAGVAVPDGWSTRRGDEFDLRRRLAGAIRW